MPFETLQRVLGEEAEPDWVQFQSFVFIYRVLLCVDVEYFLDSPLQTVTFAIDHFHIVEIKGVLFEDRMLSSSRHVKSSVFDVRRVLLDAYTGCASRRPLNSQKSNRSCLPMTTQHASSTTAWPGLNNGRRRSLCVLEMLMPRINGDRQQCSYHLSME